MTHGEITAVAWTIAMNVTSVATAIDCLLVALKCRIPDDRTDALQTNEDEKRTSLSWPASGFCS